MVRYVSTRGRAPILGFEDVLLAGLAVDGGLYVPEAWPLLSADRLAGLAGMRSSRRSSPGLSAGMICRG